MGEVSSRVGYRADEVGGLARAQQGDDDDFTRLVEPLRRELHAHCYRMLGSVHDAEDALQESLVKAWRGLDGLEARGSLRSWLYTVTTRTCLDAIRRRGRRALPVDLGPASPSAVVGDVPLPDVAWLTPFPDTGLAGGRLGPEARYDQREAVELAFVAALQHLPANQRAALVLFEVLGLSATEVAETLGLSAAAVNSALQRARRNVAERIPARSQQSTLRRLDDAALRHVASDFSAALERGDLEALIALLTVDVTWSMPPMPHWYRGLAVVADFARRVPMARCGSWRHLATSANGQLAVASYLQPAQGDAYVSWSINVLTLDDERISEITSFVGGEHFEAFGLPSHLP